jgi:hypothetical protein
LSLPVPQRLNWLANRDSFGLSRIDFRRDLERHWSFFLILDPCIYKTQTKKFKTGASIVIVMILGRIARLTVGRK